MKLSIAKLKDGDNPFRFLSSKEGWLRDLVQRVHEKGFKVSSEFTTDLNIVKIEPDYYMRGALDVGLHRTCARCAESFVLPIHHDFELALAHVPQVKAKKAELTEESEELDVIYFDGNDIELSPIIEEQFFLSVPIQPLCKRDCRGICQHCGHNLNHSECACKQDNKLSPFSVLAGVKV